MKMKTIYQLMMLIGGLLTTTSGIPQDLTLYVSTDGNDAWEGTADQPLASLHAARDKIRHWRKTTSLQDTIRVLVGPGQFMMGSPFLLHVEDGGTEDFPVIYEALDPGNTVFSGGKVLKGFKKNEEGLWVAHIPEVTYWNWTFDQLYVNGRRATRARSPNSDYFYIVDLEEEVWVEGTGRAPEKAQQTVTADKKASQELRGLDEVTLRGVVMTVFHNWDITKRHIERFDPAGNRIVTNGQGMKPWNPWKPGKRFILENYMEALDEPGEWFLDGKGNLFYYPLPGEEPDVSEVIVPVLEQLVRIEGDPVEGKYVKNIIFRGLRFQHSAYNLPAGGFEPNQAAIIIDAALELNGARNIAFEKCQIQHTGGYAVWLNQGVRHCMLKQCYLQDLGGGGIKIGETEIREEESLHTGNNIVDNCIVKSGGHVFPPAVGIWIGQSADNRITHNDIGDFSYTGISVGWRWGYDFSPAKGNKILYNHIHHIGWGILSDMSGVYTLGPSEGTEVSNNHIHHIYAYDYGGWGLYTDEGSSHILMENNLVHHTKTGGFHQHYGRENIIRNNIFAFSKMYQLQATRVEDHLSFSFRNNIVVFDEGTLYQGPWEKMTVSINENVYWNLDGPVYFKDKDFKDWKKNGYDKDSFIEDPGFADPGKGDFTLRSQRVVRKIHFNVFDYSNYGVYGEEEWKGKAQLPGSVLTSFDQLFSR